MKRIFALGLATLMLTLGCQSSNPTEPATTSALATTKAHVVLTPATDTLVVGDSLVITGLAYKSSGPCPSCQVKFYALDRTNLKLVRTFAVNGTKRAAVVLALKTGKGRLQGVWNGHADTTVVTIQAKSTPPPDTIPTPPDTTIPTQTTCHGVKVAAGASIQSAVNAASTGDTLCLSAGTYSKQTISPKAAQVIIGARGSNGERLSILDGGSTNQYAFTGSVANVVIRGTIIRGYKPPKQQGAIFGYNGTGWQIIDNEITGNTPGAGTILFSGWQLRKNFIHHNGELGITGQADAVGAVIASNEVSYNNLGTITDPNCCAGGIKLVRQTNVSILHNFVHHNTGQGIWLDYVKTGNLIRGNTVEDNTYNGIYVEVSHQTRVDSNTVRRNGASNRGGIWVDNSDNVEVAYNTVVGPSPNGLILIRMVSHNVSATDRWLHDVYIHDNAVAMASGQFVGCVQFVSDASYCSSSKANHYDWNRYSGTVAFRWNANSNISWSQWRAAGQDANGSIQ